MFFKTELILIGIYSRFVFPTGSTNACPLKIEGVRKVPTFSPHVDQELKSAIPLAKHASTVKLFNKDGVNASIMTGRDIIKILDSVSLRYFFD